MIEHYFDQTFSHKRICILGFGREGKSTYRALIKYVSQCEIIIADSNADVSRQFKEEFGPDTNTSLFCGITYTEALKHCDIIIKSPGVSPGKLLKTGEKKKMVFSSQTAIFLELFRNQVIGVTGTKGKSTTVSLLHHIFSIAGRDVILVGNIGTPPFEMLHRITAETVVVYEMSSHQLESCNASPSIAILLNIFQEHLDHYESYKDYQLAKLNIARWQQPEDAFICNDSLEVIRQLLDEVNCPGILYSLNQKSEGNPGVWCDGSNLIISDSLKNTHILQDLCIKRKLPGQHNLFNIAAAALAAHLLDVEDCFIQQAVSAFEGLPHRLELVRNFKGVAFYNDSISTIPESTIEALKTLPGVETLLLGGFDRGIDYTILMKYLHENPVKNLLFIGKAGKRMCLELQNISGNRKENCLLFDNFEDAIQKAIELGNTGGVCLLSPAAASYDMFRNFEERGEKFRQIILGLKE
jgi:UDP-N-acetylmuramoyl-L-alanine---L-glutamate ligase